MNVVHFQLLLVGLLSGILAVEMRETVELFETSKQHQTLLSEASYLILCLQNKISVERGVLACELVGNSL